MIEAINQQLTIDVEECEEIDIVIEPYEILEIDEFIESKDVYINEGFDFDLEKEEE